MKLLAFGLMLVLVLAVFGVPAFAGTTTLDFAYDVGLLTYQGAGPGVLTATGGHAHFTGANVTLLAQGGGPIYSGGTTSVTVTLQPSADAGDGVGIVMYSSGDQLTAICDGAGYVTMMDYIGNYRTLSFPYPAALNNYFTLQYDAYADNATLTLNGVQSVQLWDPLEGATSVALGVGSNGTGDLRRFVATGPVIPNYPVDTDHDGVNDDVESTLGTDPNDPGNLPVFNSQGATVHAMNGATVTIAAGSLSTDHVNVAVSTPSTIPPGSVPGGKTLSSVAVDLQPNGATFSPPATVVVPYTHGAVSALLESSLSVFYFTGADYAASGIAGVNVNTAATTVTFTTTHFTIFALAGDPRDTDDDGIDDWWEMYWFGSLSIADDTSDFDGDGIPDLREFQGWGMGLDPKLAESLPMGGPLAIVLLGAALTSAAAHALRARRRR